MRFSYAVRSDVDRLRWCLILYLCFYAFLPACAQEVHASMGFEVPTSFIKEHQRYDQWSGRQVDVACRWRKRNRTVGFGVAYVARHFAVLPSGGVVHEEGDLGLMRVNLLGTSQLAGNTRSALDLHYGIGVSWVTRLSGRKDLIDGSAVDIGSASNTTQRGLCLGLGFMYRYSLSTRWSAIVSLSSLVQLIQETDTAPDHFSAISHLHPPTGPFYLFLGPGLTYQFGIGANAPSSRSGGN